MDQQNKKSNPILWFLFAIVIPTIVMLVLVYTVLILAGIDVNAWLKNTGKKVPIVSSLITTEEELAFTELEEKYLKLKEEHESDQKTAAAELDSYEATIEQLEDEIEQLEAQLTFNEENATDETSLTTSETETVKKLSASFKTMKPKQAALIFADLDKNIAIELLETLSNDDRGKILEAMEPKQAAELTEMMYSNESSN